MGIIFPQRCGLLGRAGAALARLPWNKGAKMKEIGVVFHKQLND
jgi:hypothetical protein